MGRVRRRLRLRIVQGVGQPDGHPDRDRDATRQHEQLAGKRSRLVHLRYVLRPANIIHVHDEPARRSIRRDDGQRSAIQQRLESRLGHEGGPLRRRLGGRSRGAVQVVAVSARHRAGVGVQRDAREALEKRDLDVDARAAGARTVWIPAGAIRGHARGDRGTARRSQSGHQAVRDLESDDQHHRDAADLEPS